MTTFQRTLERALRHAGLPEEDVVAVGDAADEVATKDDINRLRDEMRSLERMMWRIFVMQTTLFGVVVGVLSFLAVR